MVVLATVIKYKLCSDYMLRAANFCGGSPVAGALGSLRINCPKFRLFVVTCILLFNLKSVSILYVTSKRK